MSPRCPSASSGCQRQRRAWEAAESPGNGRERLRETARIRSRTCSRNWERTPGKLGWTGMGLGWDFGELGAAACRTNTDQYGPVWTSLNQYKPVWTSTGLKSQFGAGKSQFGEGKSQFGEGMGMGKDQFGPIRTSTNQYGPVQTGKDQCEPVQRVMPNDSFYFSIVRNPGTLGPSSFC
ncbi:hypothetical protein DUI87_29437 [Hirundo rustica rustica]|uniref:Uncharacterized protein n=1 Tax=Hirundo rustica rustica TaxID=333673 RepID=A0A3M0IZV7_HIRRU|nr:hypothetical protein DUI87_29437 [Hirundo rustica rustica]